MQWRYKQTYIACLGLQLIEAHAILHESDEGVRLDLLRKRQCLRVADPAPRELQRGIAEACFLKIAPY
jgi:hypothetical protein